MELKKQFEAERRKSMSIEESITRLKRDNKAKANQVEELRSEVEQIREDIDILNEKLSKANKIIEALSEENEQLKSEIDHINNATINIQNYSDQIDAYRRKLSDLERDLSNAESELSSLKNELSNKERELEDKKRKLNQLAGEGQSRTLIRKDSGVGSVASDSTEEEKNHVIKVLEHESKLYNFEKNILKLMSQNQAQPAPKSFIQRVSSPIYELSEIQRPF